MEGKKLKILVIDDQTIIRNLLLDLFAEDGYQAVAVSSGQEGIAKVKQIDFDLVFSDIYMSAMTGLETIRRIKAIRPGIAFVIMPSHFNEVVKLAKKESGVLACLQKPFDIKVLRKVMENFIAQE